MDYVALGKWEVTINIKQGYVWRHLKPSNAPLETAV
jgi:hypothetical protein